MKQYHLPIAPRPMGGDTASDPVPRYEYVPLLALGKITLLIGMYTDLISGTINCMAPRIQTERWLARTTDALAIFDLLIGMLVAHLHEACQLLTRLLIEYI